MRTLTKGDLIPDFDGLYYYLSQGNSESHVENNPSRWEKDRNGYGRTLESLFDKIKPRNRIYVAFWGCEPKTIRKTLNVIYGSYSSIADKTSIAMIIATEAEKVAIQTELNDDFMSLFKDFDSFLFDYHSLVHNGFALKQPKSSFDEKDYIVPAFTIDRRHTWVALDSAIYEDLKSKYIELIHKNIGRSRSDDNHNFYLGDEISWSDIIWRGKGKDVLRNKVQQIILPEVLELLQNKPKGFWLYKLYHDASAGGTTASKRIAFEVGAQLPVSFPTIFIRKYIPNETAKGIANLYEKTDDKPILAIIEEFEIGEKLIDRLETEIRDLQKNLVVLYVCRNGNSEDLEGKIRKLPSQLETVEIAAFEDTFSDENHAKKKELLEIKNGPPKYVTPFIYGLTAFGKDFKKLDTYVDSVLNSIANQKIQATLGFIALIGKYTQNPVPEFLFYNYLNIDGPLSAVLDEQEQENIDKLFSFTEEKEGGTYVRCLKVKNQLFANDLTEKILTSRNPENRHLWKANLKNWLLEFISIAENAYVDGQLYPLDKRLLDSLFIDKENISDDEGRSNFSRLITQINHEPDGYEQSRQILTELALAFSEYPDDAFYSQHLARLYYNSAKNEQGPDINRKELYFNKSILHAQGAVALYLKKSERDKSLSGLYHTLGHASMLNIEFIVFNFNSFATVEKIDEKVKTLFKISSDALEECLSIDENSTYAYVSYSYLIVQILEFGRRVSGHTTFIDFFEDEEYEWYLSKRDLGIEIITKALDFWSKFNTNKRDDYYENEIKLNNKKHQFQLMIEQSHSKLLIFKKYQGQSLTKKEFEYKISSSKTTQIKILWQNAYIESVLGEKNFSNYNVGISKLNANDLYEIVQLLRFNLEFSPTLRDLKRWLRSTRSDLFYIDVQTAINFLEYVHKVVVDRNNHGKSDNLLTIEISYYLYCLNTIQVLNSQQSVDNEKVNKAIEFQKFCKNSARQLALRRTASYEWLGLNNKNGFEQLVSRDKLGDITATKYDFFKDFSMLREVTGVIKSVGSGSEGTERKTGEIELDNNPRLRAFFIPIYGGYVENDNGGEERCHFDNTNNVNTRVKFFLGFSFDGLRAYQVVPEMAIRAKSNQKPELKIVSIELTDLEPAYKFKVNDVLKPSQQLIGNLDGQASFTFVPFEIGKTYDDYKYFRGQTIRVVKDGNGFKIAP